MLHSTLVLPLSFTFLMTAHAWSLGGFSSPSLVHKSAFMGKSRVVTNPSPLSTSSLVMYENPYDPPNDNRQQRQQRGPNAWNVLADTEKWISSTLQSSNTGPGGQNPYSRKEVSYACETSSESSMILAQLFRRLKEARELGEKHGRQEVMRAEEAGSSYRPSTLRQTQVVVIPGNEEFQKNFVVYNSFIEAVNEARRHARDYVTEAHWDRMDSAEDGDEEDTEWSVAINCAHLHPDFGKKSPEEELQEMKQEEEDGEVDVHYEEYKKKRDLARQSPYPTVVIEVRATPPPDFGAMKPPPPPATPVESSSSSEGGVSAEDIMKLEQLFGKSAHMAHPTKHTTTKQEEEAFYSAIGGNIQELSAVTPLAMAQNYMVAADPTIPATAAFTDSSTAQVDEAYEFVFTNVAMMTERVKQSSEQEDIRHYVVLPNFLASSATSLEKFAAQCQAILDTLPDLKQRIHMQTYHPEHVHEAQRSPMPILRLQWNYNVQN